MINRWLAMTIHCFTLGRTQSTPVRPHGPLYTNTSARNAVNQMYMAKKRTHVDALQKDGGDGDGDGGGGVDGDVGDSYAGPLLRRPTCQRVGNGSQQLQGSQPLNVG